MSCGACPGIIDVKCDCKSFANKKEIYPWFDTDPSMGGGFFDHERDTSHRLVVRASSSYFGVAVRVFLFLTVPAGSQKLRRRQGVMNGGNQLKKKYCAWHEHLYFNTKRCIPTALRIQHVLHHIFHLPHDKVFNLKVGHWNRKVSSTG